MNSKMHLYFQLFGAILLGILGMVIGAKNESLGFSMGGMAIIVALGFLGSATALQMKFSTYIYLIGGYTLGLLGIYFSSLNPVAIGLNLGLIGIVCMIGFIGLVVLDNKTD